MDATVTLTTWEIWNSNLGNSETRNYASGPAIGTPVVFNVTAGDGAWGADSGSGHITTIFTDGDGRSRAQFYMRGWDSNVTVSASYNSSESSAGLTFSLPTDPIWSKLGDYHDLIVNVSASATTAAAVPVNATVSYRTWEVWGNDQNSNTEIRNDTTSAAINAPVSVLVASGNGSVSSSTTSSDTSGGYGARYMAASLASVVTVSANFTSPRGTVSGSGSVSISNLDTDGDSYSNADENTAGTNPNDANDNPDTRPQYDDHWYQGSYSVIVSWTENFDPLSLFADDTSVSIDGHSIGVAVGGWNWSKEHPEADPNWRYTHGAVTPNSVPEPPNGGYWAPGVTWETTGSSLTLDQTTNLQYGLLDIRPIYRLRELQYTITWRRLYRVPRQ